MWYKFINAVNTGISHYVPNYKSLTSTQTRRYYPARIRKLHAKKLRSWKLYKTFQTAELLTKYRRLSNACLSSVKHFQNSIEENLVNNGNLGLFYK